MAAALAAFFAFSLAASAGYVFNDLRDLEHDRQHPDKRHRPLASGRVGPSTARKLIFLLTAAALAVCLALPWPFAALLAGYMALSFLYSWRLKRLRGVDVTVLTILYTSRLLAGGLATGIPISPWLAAFSLALFAGLALAKRTIEAMELRNLSADRIGGREYAEADLPRLRTAGMACSALAVVVLAGYLQSPTVEALYHTPLWLWGSVAGVALGLVRIWQLVLAGRMHSDPIISALRDPFSYLTLAVVLGFAWISIS